MEKAPKLFGISYKKLSIIDLSIILGCKTLFPDCSNN